MEHLLASSARPLWLICESPLTSYYERFGFIEVKDQSAMPPYFQSARWFTRIAMDWFLALRGSYIAYMVLNAGVTSPQGAGDAS